MGDDCADIGFFVWKGEDSGQGFAINIGEGDFFRLRGHDDEWLPNVYKSFRSLEAMILKNCRFVITQDEKRSILENIDIRIEGSVIKDISKDIVQHSDEQVIDCSVKIVMPGLINTHCHNSMQLLKGVCDDDPAARKRSSGRCGGGRS